MFASLEQIPEMFNPTVHWLELIARGFLTYIFLIIILRLTGKRQIGQLAPFDLVLLLVLSNSVQNAMNGGDNSFTAGVISAMTLVAANYITGAVTARSKWFERIVEGRPKILVHNGRVLAEAMAEEQITHHELMAGLRAAGIANVHEVHFAVLENSGHISVVPRSATTTDDRHPDSLPSELVLAPPAGASSSQPKS